MKFINQISYLIQKLIHIISPYSYLAKLTLPNKLYIIYRIFLIFIYANDHMNLFIFIFIFILLLLLLLLLLLFVMGISRTTPYELDLTQQAGPIA